MTKDISLELGLLTSALANQLPEAKAFDARQALDLVINALDEFGRKLELDKQSGQYTISGLQNHTSALAREADGKIKKFEQNHLNVVERRIAETKKSMLQAVQGQRLGKDTNPVVQYLREKEIRDVLRTKDILEVQEIFRTTDDPDILAAIENAPAVAPLIDLALVAAGQVALAERLDPESAQLVGELQATAEYWLYFVQVARRGIEAQLGARLHDPISDQAGAGEPRK